MAALTLAVFAIAWRLSRPAQGLLVRIADRGAGGVRRLQPVVGAAPAVRPRGPWAHRPGRRGGPRPAVAGARRLALGEHPRVVPLGLAFLVVVAVGQRLDGEAPAVELRCLRWLGLGILAGAVNPLGPRILLFPLELLQRQDVLRHIVEWQAPNFISVGDRIFLLQVMVAVLALVRRPRYREGLVVVVFVAAALLGAANIAVASLVLVPVLAGPGRTSAASGPTRELPGSSGLGGDARGDGRDPRVRARRAALQLRAVPHRVARPPRGRAGRPRPRCGWPAPSGSATSSSCGTGPCARCSSTTASTCTRTRCPRTR